MLRLVGKLPKEPFGVAVSGGVDSQAAVYFFLRARKNFSLLYFNHGTEHGALSQAFVTRKAAEWNLPLCLGHVNRTRQPRESEEAYWREQRYQFLHAFPFPVVTAHHLDDVMETWIFSALHGKPKIILPRFKNIVRPFLLTDKAELERLVQRNKGEFIQDESNYDCKHLRNYIRWELMPKALVVNPGLRKVVSKLIRQYHEQSTAGTEGKPLPERIDFTAWAAGERKDDPS